MLDLNTFIVVSVATILVMVGVLAWVVDAGVSDKYRAYIKYGLFSLLAGLLGMFFMVKDDAEFQYSALEKSQKKGSSDRGGGGMGGDGGGGGSASFSDGGGGGDADISADGGAGGEGNANIAATGEEDGGLGGGGEGGEGEMKAGQVEQDCDFCPEVVTIGPGTALIGSPLTVISGGAQSGPASQATFTEMFAIGKYEVTLGEYQAFVTATGHKSSPTCSIAGTRRMGVTYSDPGFPQSERQPAVCLSWIDAKTYTDWLSEQSGRVYRLPTEVEWEYAARAGMTTGYVTGSQIDSTKANFADKRGKRENRTIDVGLFEANANGLHDVHGNVWEMTEDCWSPKYQIANMGSIHSGPVDCSRHIVKGGGWFSNAEQLDLSMRTSVKSDYASNGVGFRVMRERKIVAASQEGRDLSGDGVGLGGMPTDDGAVQRHMERLKRMGKAAETVTKLTGGGPKDRPTTR